MMSSVIRQETAVFLLSVGHGIGLTLGYDLLRAVRRAFRHNLAAISAEDFLFWLAAGFLTFCLAFLKTDGVLRGYVVVGILLGAVFYHFALSDYIVGGLSGLLKLVRRGCAQVCRLLQGLFGYFGRLVRKTLAGMYGLTRNIVKRPVGLAGRILKKLAGGTVCRLRRILPKRPGKKQRKSKKRIVFGRRKGYNEDKPRGDTDAVSAGDRQKTDRQSRQYIGKTRKEVKRYGRKRAARKYK